MEKPMTHEEWKKAVGERFVELVRLMEELRGSNGCPWDREQTHESLRKYLIEEAHEACEAIDHGDTRKIAEELGDVLLQVVFHGQMAREAGTFTVLDIIESINRKLIERHPHVFGDEHYETPEEVLQNWEVSKAKKKGSHSSLLSGIPSSLPALLRSRRLQERAAQVGFDWNNLGEVFTKVEEELGEFRGACEQGCTDRIEDELGDFLFSVVNVSRYLAADPEAALHRTSRKFIARFQYIEDKARAEGRNLEEMTVQEMDRYWEEAKELEKEKDRG